MSSQSIVNKRKDLLAAALQLFVQYGFHGTPTSKIAKLAGVANGTLFHYYSTKEDLIVSLYIDIKRRMADDVDANAIPGETVKETFRNQFTKIVLWSLRNSNEFYFIQQFHSSPFSGLVPPEEITKQLSKTCNQLEDAIRQKAIKARDVDFILTLFTSHIFGLNQYLTKSKFNEEEQRKIIYDSFEMLWTMIS